MDSVMPYLTILALSAMIVPAEAFETVSRSRLRVSAVFMSVRSEVGVPFLILNLQPLQQWLVVVDYCLR